MKRLIVGSIEALSMIIIAGLHLLALILGWSAGDLWGALMALAAAFMFSVISFGALFLFLEMNESLRQIRGLLEAKK